MSFRNYRGIFTFDDVSIHPARPSFLQRAIAAENGTKRCC